MSLTDTKIRNARPKGKQYRLTDRRGLYLLVRDTGAKWWRYDYRVDGKRKTLSMGTYPDISLADARARHQEARSLVAKGVDPSDARKAEKQARAEADSLEAIARERHARQSKAWTDGHAARVLIRFEKDLFP